MAGTEMDMVGVSENDILMKPYRTSYHKSLMREHLKTEEKWLDL